MSSRTDGKPKRKAENGFADEGGAASVFGGKDYASLSNFVALSGSGESGYDDELYGGTGAGSTQYLRTEVAPEDEIEQPSSEGPARVSSRTRDVSYRESLRPPTFIASTKLILRFLHPLARHANIVLLQRRNRHILTMKRAAKIHSLSTRSERKTWYIGTADIESADTAQLGRYI